MLASMYPPSVGGIQTHTRALSRALVRQGLDVWVITRRHAGLPRESIEDGVTVLRVGDGDAPHALATASYLAGTVAAVRSLGDYVDVLHAHQMLSPMTCALLAGPLCGKSIVINPHACGPIGDVAQLQRHRRFTGFLRLESARRMGDAFVSINRVITGELTALGIEEERIWSLPNGVDIEQFHPASAEEKRALREQLGLPKGPLVIASGRLAPEKGVDVLLESWSRVASAREDATLVVLGDGPERAKLEAQAAARGISQRVRFTGAVTDVASYLRAADVFALPSRTEGLPVALLEAMACGLPSVATRVGGTPEVLEDPESGWLVPSQTPSELGAALLEALGAEAGARGAAARERVVARYSLDEVARRYVQLYGQLVKRGARSRRKTSWALGEGAR